MIPDGAAIRGPSLSAAAHKYGDVCPLPYGRGSDSRRASDPSRDRKGAVRCRSRYVTVIPDGSTWPYPQVGLLDTSKCALRGRQTPPLSASFRGESAGVRGSSRRSRKTPNASNGWSPSSVANDMRTSAIRN